MSIRTPVTSSISQVPTVFTIRQLINAQDPTASENLSELVSTRALLKRFQKESMSLQWTNNAFTNALKTIELERNELKDKYNTALSENALLKQRVQNQEATMKDDEAAAVSYRLHAETKIAALNEERTAAHMKLEELAAVQTSIVQTYSGYNTGIQPSIASPKEKSVDPPPPPQEEPVTNSHSIALSNEIEKLLGDLEVQEEEIKMLNNKLRVSGEIINTMDSESQFNRQLIGKMDSEFHTLHLFCKQEVRRNQDQLVTRDKKIEMITLLFKIEAKMHKDNITHLSKAFKKKQLEGGTTPTKNQTPPSRPYNTLIDALTRDMINLSHTSNRKGSLVTCK